MGVNCNERQQKGKEDGVKTITRVQTSRRVFDIRKVTEQGHIWNETLGRVSYKRRQQEVGRTVGERHRRGATSICRRESQTGVWTQAIPKTERRGRNGHSEVGSAFFSSNMIQTFHCLFQFFAFHPFQQQLSDSFAYPLLRFLGQSIRSVGSWMGRRGWLYAVVAVSVGVSRCLMIWR